MPSSLWPSPYFRWWVGERRSLSCPVVYMMKSTSPCPKPCLALPSKPQQQTPTTSAAWPHHTTSNAQAFSFVAASAKARNTPSSPTSLAKIGSRARCLALSQPPSNADQCIRTRITTWHVDAPRLQCGKHKQPRPGINRTDHFAFSGSTLHVARRGKTSLVFRTGVSPPFWGRSTFFSTGQGHVL